MNACVATAAVAVNVQFTPPARPTRADKLERAAADAGVKQLNVCSVIDAARIITLRA